MDYKEILEGWVKKAETYNGKLLLEEYSDALISYRSYHPLHDTIIRGIKLAALQIVLQNRLEAGEEGATHGE